MVFGAGAGALGAHKDQVCQVYGYLNLQHFSKDFGQDGQGRLAFQNHLLLPQTPLSLNRPCCLRAP
jgi:hypothetical protein